MMKDQERENSLFRLSVEVILEGTLNIPTEVVIFSEC